MAEIIITKEDCGPTGGRYVAKVGGLAGEAELTFTRSAPDLVRADHTGAPEALRGTGAAAALVRYLVGDARAGGFRIVAACPYVRAQYARNPDWSDVFADAPEG